MAQIQKPEQIPHILTSALKLLEDGTDWSQLDFPALAGESNISAEIIKQHFPTKKDLYKGLLLRIDRKLECDTDRNLHAETPRDRLFEILMLRFDILNENRDAYRQLFYTTFKDPVLFRTALPRFHESMESMLRLADLNGRNGSGCPPLRTGALAIVFLNTVRVWLNDDSEDMAPTMAELDRGLSKLDQLRSYIPDPLRTFV